MHIIEFIIELIYIVIVLVYFIGWSYIKGDIKANLSVFVSFNDESNAL
jgi:hypothetical protein